LNTAETLGMGSAKAQTLNFTYTIEADDFPSVTTVGATSLKKTSIGKTALQELVPPQCARTHFSVKRSYANVSYDHTIPHIVLCVRRVGDSLIVSCDDYRGFVFAAQAEKQLCDLTSGFGVKFACGFVCKN
jgi:hypothetical protein